MKHTKRARRRHIGHNQRKHNRNQREMSTEKKEYSEAELNCRACMGPCGLCEHLTEPASSIIQDFRNEMSDEFEKKSGGNANWSQNVSKTIH